MGLYLCRWENGDFSVVQDKTKDDAIEILDDAANAEGLPLHAISDFMAHFRLSDEEKVEFEGFGGEFFEYVRERSHPQSSCRCAFRSNRRMAMATSAA